MLGGLPKFKTLLPVCSVYQEMKSKETYLVILVTQTKLLHHSSLNGIVNIKWAFVILCQ